MRQLTDHTPAPRTRLQAEPLEDRLVPAQVVPWPSGVLTINPDPGRALSVEVADAGNGRIQATADGITNTYSGMTALQINGGAYADTITIASTPAGVPVRVNTGGGSDRVNIEANRSPVDVINSGGEDGVWIGRSGSMQGVAGPVSVSNDACSGSTTSLTLDDWTDATSRSVTVSPTAVAGLSPAPISFDNGTSLSVFGGWAGNTFDVQNTPSGRVYLSTGLGNDRVYVRNTTGPLDIEGEYGRDSVTIGYRDSNPGSLLGIAGEVFVNNRRGRTALQLDRRADQTAGYLAPIPVDGQDWAHTITGLSPAPISRGDGVMVTILMTDQGSILL